MNADSRHWTIRDARPGDWQVIAGFNERLALETEGRKLDPDALAAGVRRLLAEPSMGRYFVAEEDGQVIGQAMVTYEWSDWHNALYWWLQSVYVLPDRRGQGVFRGICEHISRLAAQDAGACSLRLYMESNNSTARAVYLALGFTGCGYEVLEKKLSPATPGSAAP